jgi:hypothetical protein
MVPEKPIQRPRLSRKKRLFFTAITVVIFLLFSGLLYLSTVFWRTSRMYDEPRRWIGSVYQPDEEFGSFPKPNSRAHHALPYGKSIPVAFDRNGFRVPLEERSGFAVDTPKILFLGGSFTHGYGVPAEETFAYLAAKELDSRSLNAGLSGAGLSYMVMRAKREIPPFKPSWVVVQYSSWLVRRSLRFYQPTKFGKTPLPYFYESDGSVQIHPPVFVTTNFELPVAEYARKGLLPYFWNVGLPLFTHDDYHVALTSTKSLLGILPRPARSRQRVVDYAYKEIEEVCREYGANMLVLKLYSGINNRSPDELGNLSSPVIDTLPVLSSGLPEKTDKEWRERYYLRAGDPPRVVDSHPNEAAHRLIAEAIVNAIRTAVDQKQ